MNMQQKQQQGYNKSMEQQQHQTDSHPLNNGVWDGDGYTQNEQQQPLQHSQDTSQNPYQTYYEVGQSHIGSFGANHGFRFDSYVELFL